MFRNYLEKLSLALLGLTFLLYPLLFTNLTTEFYVLPKQALLGGVTLLLLVFWAIRMIAEKSVRVRKTPFDLPLILFGAALIASSAFAVNRIDSFLSTVPLLFAIVLYFITVNFVRERKEVYFLFTAFFLGASLVAVNSLLSYFKIYVIPFEYTHSQVFSPLGSQLEQAIYLAIALVTSSYLAFPDFKNILARKRRIELKDLGGIATRIILLSGLVTTIITLVTVQKPAILPYHIGFQTAFAAISQDAGRIIQSFLFGGGFGTYINVFTRFKASVINLDPSLWSLTFLRSSSFILELLATTGMVGLLSFGFIALGVIKRRANFWPLVFALVLMLLLPFSFVTQVLFFLVLSLLAIHEGLTSNRYHDVELALVTLQKGIFSTTNREPKGFSRILPFVFALLIFALVGAALFFSTRYVIANTLFQKSFVAVAKNNGTEAYNHQSRAISLVPYSDAYQRSFSQTNLALANSLSSNTPKTASPAAQTQQTILTLVQQSINAGRTAVSVSPQTALNWQNLSSIYRSLIGFGKNADSFAILAAQQATALDPNNPQQHVNLGGLYYQLGLWDRAEEQFRVAISLKPDFANAYYNLAHTFEQKGNIEEALKQLDIVKTLVRNDKENLEKVEAEIATLKAGLQIESDLDEKEGTLPPQTPPIEIPAPVSTTSAQ